MAVVGDNPGPKPEVIAPLDKLQKMLGQTTTAIADVRLKGEDMVLVFNRYEKKQLRIR